MSWVKVSKVLDSPEQQQALSACRRTTAGRNGRVPLRKGNPEGPLKGTLKALKGNPEGPLKGPLRNPLRLILPGVPWGSFPAWPPGASDGFAQRSQHPLIEEYTLNHNMKAAII